jgi:fatty-acyl-CoA synthase
MAELLRITVGTLLDEVTSRFPKNEVLVDLPKAERYTYRKFLDRVNQLAKGLLKLGIEKEDHVALWAPNLSEWIITEFAVAKIGDVLISVDTNAQLQQLEYFLRQSDSKCLVMTEGVKGTEYVDILHQLCPEIKDSSAGKLKCKALPELKNVILISDRTYRNAQLKA